MPYLEIVEPDAPPRRVDVTGPVVVGRGADCEVQIVEKKSSRRHFRIRSEPGQPWIVEDLDSSNGTFVGEARILRQQLSDGTVLRVGDTLFTWRQEAAAALVGGKLALRAVGPGAAPAPAPAPARRAEPAVPVAARVEVAAGAPEAGGAGGADDADDAPATGEPETVIVRPVRPLDLRSFGRAAALLVVGILAVGGVHFLLGEKARKAEEEVRARKSLQDLLARADADTKAFAREADTWLATWPRSPDRTLLERHLEAVRGRSGVREGVEARFDTILARLGSLPEAQVRSELLAFKRELPEDPGLAERVRLAFVELDRRRAAYEKAEGERVREEAALLVEQNLPGVALRLLQSWRSGRGVLSPEEAARLGAAEDQTLAAIRTLAEITLASAKRETDPEKRRRMLQAAWPGLAGTTQQEAIADALRYADSPVANQAGSSTPAPGTAPDAGEALLARATEAERLAGARRWVDARAAFDTLAQEKAPASLQQEWTTRRYDMDRVLSLVKTLAEDVAGGKPVTKKLAGGLATVTAADAARVSLERGGAKSEPAWAEVDPEDVLPLLTPAKPTAEQRLGLAVLAASLGKPDALVQALAPLYEPGPAPTEADAVVARLLHGKSKAPEGGYRLHQGELLDRAGYEQRVETARLAALEGRAVEAVLKLSKEPVFKRLEKMRQARAELDKRRLEALLAIFNETHYPYPYSRGVPPYTLVQAEVDRRVEAVRALWEGDEHMKISRTGPHGKLADEVAAAIRDLEAKGRDVIKLKAHLARYEPYMTGETITLKEFALNSAERKFMAYNRWVLDTYNPAQTGYISDAERQQVQITNEYRMMMGFTCTVTPGDAAYESIDAANVARVFDAGKIVPGSVVNLRVLRIDDRLVKSARVHSLDMQKKGYFDHFSQADPATGAPRKSPFDRMRDAGYEGSGASENIARSGSFRDAHISWCHSSGHHRNILSSWTDMGTGAANEGFWTQNFGNGGGKKAEIEAPAAPTTPTPKK